MKWIMFYASVFITCSSMSTLSDIDCLRAKGQMNSTILLKNLLRARPIVMNIESLGVNGTPSIARSQFSPCEPRPLTFFAMRFVVTWSSQQYDSCDICCLFINLAESEMHNNKSRWVTKKHLHAFLNVKLSYCSFSGNTWKILDSDWLKRSSCSFRATWMQNCTPVQSCNTNANYKLILIGLETIGIIQS